MRLESGPREENGMPRTVWNFTSLVARQWNAGTSKDKWDSQSSKKAIRDHIYNQPWPSFNSTDSFRWPTIHPLHSRWTLSGKKCKTRDVFAQSQNLASKSSTADNSRPKSFDILSQICLASSGLILIDPQMRERLPVGRG